MFWIGIALREEDVICSSRWGINYADDDATNVAHDNPEEAENSFDAGAAAS